MENLIFLLLLLSKELSVNMDTATRIFTLVLPYMKAEYRDNEKEYLDYYDEVEVCEESSEAHPKAAILIRNRYLVYRSDLIVCCIQRESGGAYKSNAVCGEAWKEKS